MRKHENAFILYYVWSLHHIPLTRQISNDDERIWMLSCGIHVWLSQSCSRFPLCRTWISLQYSRWCFCMKLMWGVCYWNRLWRCKLGCISSCLMINFAFVWQRNFGFYYQKVGSSSTFQPNYIQPHKCKPATLKNCKTYKLKSHFIAFRFLIVDIRCTKLGSILTEGMVYPCALHRIPEHVPLSFVPFST
jgi:hypothetical protein